MSELGEKDPMLLVDPLKSRMWHSKFEVHKVPDIPMAELKPQTRASRCESVKDFLNRSKLNTLVPSPVQSR